MDRRSYLRAIAAVGGVGVAGCSESPTGTEGATGTDAPTNSEDGTATSEMTGSGTASPTTTGTPTDTPTPTPRPEVAAEVAVGPEATFRFEPDTVEVAVGETVRWVWGSLGHNIKPEDVPEGSDWTGTPGDRGETFASGYVHTHTFEVAGTYDYVCVPHRTSGMVGTVVVA